jgi:hypothetical protein
MLLDGNSEICGLGEVASLSAYARGERGPKGSFLGSPFWQEADVKFRQLTGKGLVDIDLSHPIEWPAIEAWGAYDLEKFARENSDFFESMAGVANKRILVDSSKSAKRLYLLHKTGAFDIKAIHLLRDGRAVVNSYVRLYGRKGYEMGIHYFKMRNNEAARIRRYFSGENWLQVRYEEFCIAPEPSLKNICAFIGVTYEPQMFGLEREYYNGILLNANIMRKRQEGRPGQRILLDEKWKRELAWYYKIGFMLRAGMLNRRMGY